MIFSFFPHVEYAGWMTLSYYRGFPDSSVGKESACNAGDLSSIPGWGRSAGEGIGYPLQYSWASLCGPAGKESACNAGDLGLIPGLGRSLGEGKSHAFQYCGLENSMGSHIVSHCYVHICTICSRLWIFFIHFCLSSRSCWFSSSKP